MSNEENLGTASPDNGNESTPSKLNLKTIEAVLKIMAILVGGLWVVFHFWKTEVPKLYVAADLQTKIGYETGTKLYNVRVQVQLSNIGLTQFDANSLKMNLRRFKENQQPARKNGFLDLDDILANGESITNVVISAPRNTVKAVLGRYPQNTSRSADYFFFINNLTNGDNIVAITTVDYSAGFSHETNIASAWQTYRQKN